MTEQSKNVAILALVAAVAFLVGRELRPDPAATTGLSASPLASQGRRTGSKSKGTIGDGKVPLVFESSGVSSASASNGVIAVTGSYGVGTSVLYVIDTKRQQLAVYEARGGSTNSRRIFLVGARRMDLDLQLQGYNDESEYSYAELQKRFESRRDPEAPVRPKAGTVPKGPGRGDR